MGIYNIDLYKGNTKINIPTTTGQTVDCTNQIVQDGLKFIIEQKANEYNYMVEQGWDEKTLKNTVQSDRWQNAVKESGIAEFGNNYLRTEVDLKSGYAYDVVKKEIHISQDIVDKVNSGIDAQSLTNKQYKFDKSGFTW